MTLMQLLRWAHRQHELETPPLEHAVAHTDEGGSPEMKPAPAAYLGLLARRRLDRDARTTNDGPDDWRRLACRVVDGHYATPLRCAIARIAEPGRRAFLEDLVPELYFPTEIAELHGIPRWAAGDVTYRSLTILRDKYREIPETPTHWIDKSGSQQAAEVEAA